MLRQIRNYVLIALVIGAFYFILSNHFLFASFSDITLLKKSELSLKYTFVSMNQQTPKSMLRIDALREAGIEDLLLKKGLVSEEKLSRILGELEAEQSRQ